MVILGCKNELKAQEEQVLKFEKPKGNSPGKVTGNIIGCAYDELKNSSKILLYSPGTKEISQINNILSYSGLPSNFQVYEADIDNALAVIVNGERLIIYDKDLFNLVDRNANSYWASLSILAHEIGHHLSAHTLAKSSSLKAELEADKFSGNILFKLGASLEQSTSAIAMIGSNSNSDTHPNKNSRLKAIAEGWNTASSNRYKSAIPPPPDNEYLFDNGTVQNEFFKEELISKAALNAPNFGGYINADNDRFIEGIIIDVEKDDPSGGQRTEYFESPPSEFNLVITLDVTNSNDADYKVGSRKTLHLLDYYQASNATFGTLQSLLVPGRKIRVKAVYFGYGAEDIYYIKRLPRNITSSQGVNTSNRNVFEVKSDRSYFHNSPLYSTRRKAYLVKGEILRKLKEENGFIYIEFINPKGQKSVGWVLKSTLK